MDLKELLFGATRIPLIGKGLDAFALRHRAISDNVANSETPGYNRREVEFEEKLKQLIGKDRMTVSHPDHIGGSRSMRLSEGELGYREVISAGGSFIREDKITPELLTDRESSDVSDINNIDIDREMGDMAANHLQFTFAAKMDKAFFDLLKSSISGV